MYHQVDHQAAIEVRAFGGDGILSVRLEKVMADAVLRVLIGGVRECEPWRRG